MLSYFVSVLCTSHTARCFDVNNL